MPFIDLEEELAELDGRGRRRKLKAFKPLGPTRAELDGREVTLFASNDYLGLAWHPKVIAAFEEAVKTHGVGSGASRLITGTSDLHAKLEERIARFKRTEAAIVFSSGYLANWGVITALAGKDDFIAIDKLNHASIIDAVRASGARVRVFPHKNYERLEELLKLGTGYRHRPDCSPDQPSGAATPSARPPLVQAAVPEDQAAAPLVSVGQYQRHQVDGTAPTRAVGADRRSINRRRLVVTDSVFSMDGDTADLKKLVRLKNLYGAWLMLDEAHGTGVFGERGAGLAEAEGVEDEIDIRMGTLSKACGAMGGFVAGSGTLIDYLRNHARSFIYSTALPPAVMAASVVAIDIIENDSALRKRLWDNVQFLRDALEKVSLRGAPAGATKQSPSLEIASATSGTVPRNDMPSPIIPIIIGDDERTMEMSEALLREGYYVPGIRPPTVPRGEARLRVTVSAAHSEEELRGFVGAFERICHCEDM